MMTIDFWAEGRGLKLLYLIGTAIALLLDCKRDEHPTFSCFS